MALPANSQRPLRIALVAGEPSGDLLGADLMRALKAHSAGDIEFIGVGGPRMEAVGLQSYFPQERLAVMGLVEVLGRLPELLWRRRSLSHYLRQAQPDVLIGIDAPDFNLGLERHLRGVGIPTVHYVSPSVWAWRQKRVFKIKQACDLILTLLPFEARFYEAHQVPVRFVGHPLADDIPQSADRAAARQQLGLADGGPLVALLPGSRGGEITRLGPLFLATAQLLHAHSPELRFILPCASPARRQQLERLLVELKIEVPIELVDGQAQVALAASDVVLIASGTATLEAMLYKRPMVVAYQVSEMTYRIARRLVKTPFFALPNLLAGEALVPEFIQAQATPEHLAAALLPLLGGAGEAQTRRFSELHKILQKNASSQAAAAVLELLERQ